MSSLFDYNSLLSSYERLEEGALLLRGFANTEAALLF
jgi:hypothetical protein